MPANAYPLTEKMLVAALSFGDECRQQAIKALLKDSGFSLETEEGQRLVNAFARGFRTAQEIVPKGLEKILDHQRLVWLVAEALIKTHPVEGRAEQILGRSLVMDIQTTGDEIWSVATPGDSSFYIVFKLSNYEYHIHDADINACWCSYGTFQVCGVGGQESVSFTPRQETTG